MRILHTNMLRGWGGQSNRILLEIRGALAAGHDVALAAPFDSVLCTKAAPLGATVLPGYRFKPPAQVWRSVPDLWRLRRDLAAWRPDLIHLHGSQDTWLVVLARMVARARGEAFPPLVRTKHNVFPWRPHALNRWLYGRLDAFIVVSEAVRAQVAAFPGLAARPCLTRPSVPDLGRIRGETDRLRREIPGLPEGAFVWGSTGRMQPEKGFDVLVRAFARVRAARPQAFLVAVGSGGQLGAYQELAREVGLLPGGAWFAGFRDDVPALLRAFDAYVLASRADGLPTAVLEALTAGLPIVSTRVGGIPEIVRPGETGVLVPPDDPEALAAAMLGVMDGTEPVESFRRNGPKLIEERFSEGALFAETLAFYGRVLEASGRGSQRT